MTPVYTIKQTCCWSYLNDQHVCVCQHGNGNKAKRGAACAPGCAINANNVGPMIPHFTDTNAAHARTPAESLSAHSHKIMQTCTHIISANASLHVNSRIAMLPKNAV